MKKNLIFKICIVVCLGLSTLPATAQQVNTMYFMENVPVRHYLNPAFQPDNDFYLGLPIIGYSQFGLGNNSITLKDVVYKKNGQSVLFLNSNTDRDVFYNKIKQKSTTLFETNLHLNLLDFGFRTGPSYWSFSLTEKINGQLGIPSDLFKLMLYGTPDSLNVNSYDFKKLGFDITAYTEAAFGYSRIINNRLTVGGKFKLLLGTANMSMVNQNLKLDASSDSISLKGNGSVNYSSRVNLNGNNLQTLNFSMPTVSDMLKPTGIGAAIDLGVTYKPIEQLTISAAVIDLGMIDWISKNGKSYGYNVDYKFKGLKNIDINTNIDTLLNSELSNLQASIKDSIINIARYMTYLSPKINVGVEYSFLNNKLSLGLLSRTMITNKVPYEELTASVNGRPKDWLNMSLSYSVINGRMSNIGAGVGLRTGPVNWFFSADYVSLNKATFPLTLGSSTSDFPIGYNSKGFNFALGINIVIRNRKDTDHDGVVNKTDQCPETPYSVIVDRKGCPLDTDGDGVPDYLDRCAKTPPEAYNHIDQNGCPVDNDSDGVADYKDRCPDTPKEAIKYVDKFGCVADTDKDGIFNYKDSCPNTPIGVKVDSIGCPLDSDGDGVPDELDKCPDTPVKARGFVDKNGCTLDTDGDGVPDYIDKCPNTPAEERAMVDSTGCTKHQTLKINKTDVDTDGDGVPDKLDKCPKVPGPASNNGCPEVAKKDYKALFQKALQGIRFETAKSVIMPVSYKILNQIAGVLIANPTYIVEIRGHTDNVGKPAANLILSQNRAKSVKKYLVKKGVDEKRMTANGFGDTLPVATNKTAKGKAINRRVEFVVTFEEITFE